MYHRTLVRIQARARARAWANAWVVCSFVRVRGRGAGSLEEARQAQILRRRSAGHCYRPPGILTHNLPNELITLPPPLPPPHPPRHPPPLPLFRTLTRPLPHRPPSSSVVWPPPPPSSTGGSSPLLGGSGSGSGEAWGQASG